MSYQCFFIFLSKDGKWFQTWRRNRASFQFFSLQGMLFVDPWLKHTHGGNFCPYIRWWMMSQRYLNTFHFLQIFVESLSLCILYIIRLTQGNQPHWLGKGSWIFRETCLQSSQCRFWRKYKWYACDCSPNHLCTLERLIHRMLPGYRMKVGPVTWVTEQIENWDKKCCLKKDVCQNCESFESGMDCIAKEYNVV